MKEFFFVALFFYEESPKAGVSNNTEPVPASVGTGSVKSDGLKKIAPKWAKAGITF